MPRASSPARVVCPATPSSRAPHNTPQPAPARSRATAGEVEVPRITTSGGREPPRPTESTSPLPRTVLRGRTVRRKRLAIGIPDFVAPRWYAYTVLVMAKVVFERIAPVVTVRDVGAALDRYGRLGFTTEVDETANYGFVTRDGAQLHIAPNDPDEPDKTGGVVYVYVSNADALHAEWASARVEGRFLGPHNTPYGLREFVYTDPDGIVHRVGSSLTTNDE